MRCYPIFSDEDADLRDLKWNSRDGYARRTHNYRDSDGKYKATKIYAHRMVLARMLGREQVRGEVCDHINQNRLDNRRENLRAATYSQNRFNCAQAITGRPPGVVFRHGKWLAQVSFRGKCHYCGSHSTLSAAAAAAHAKRVELGLDEPAGVLTGSD
jgi:hypothetical protein